MSGTTNCHIIYYPAGIIIRIFGLNKEEAIEYQTIFGRFAMRWEIQLVFDNYGETTIQ